MPKKFYTEKDVEDLFYSGIKSLQISDDVVLTELAYEKAKGLGFQLISDAADHPPAAPVRPYLSDSTAPVRAKPIVAPGSPAVSPLQQLQPNVLPIEQRIRSAVIAKLGDQVDGQLLNNIIHRVVKGIGLK